MPHPKCIRLSIAGTAAVALASLPLAVSPVSAAKVSEGTTSSIGVIEASSDAQQFNLKTQGASTVLVASRGANDGGVGKAVVQRLLQKLQKLLGFSTTCAFPYCIP